MGVTSDVFWVCCDCFIAHISVEEENVFALIWKKIMIKEGEFIKGVLRERIHKLLWKYRNSEFTFMRKKI